MGYQSLELEKWSRIKQYRFFKRYDNPFFNICSTLDVTNLVEATKSQGWSFSTCLLYASIDVANKMKEFRYRLKDDGVIVYDSIYAGSTLLNNDKTFSFCYFDYFTDFKRFYQSAMQQIDLNKLGLLEFDGRNEDLDIIHYSVIPWIHFSSFSHPRNYQTNDSIPKIVFGKYQQKSGRFILPISVEVHHALMDGYHLGQYLSQLQKAVTDLKFLTQIPI
jgi:chloramphenicol O-acetyltransferase type A